MSSRILFVLLLLWLSLPAWSQCPIFAPGVSVGTLQSAQIDEASGLAASRKNPHVLWVHNDSGDSPRVFAIHTDGTLLGTYSLSGATAIDFEDMAIGPGPVEGVDYLYLGDIGDNSAIRSDIKVYRVAEPIVDANQAPVTTTLTGVETITLQYPDGARDAETLMIDPPTRDLYIISKREIPSRVYRVAYPQSTTSTTVMEYKISLPWGWATGVIFPRQDRRSLYEAASMPLSGKKTPDPNCGRLLPTHPVAFHWCLSRKARRSAL